MTLDQSPKAVLEDTQDACGDDHSRNCTCANTSQTALDTDDREDDRDVHAASCCQTTESDDDEGGPACCASCSTNAEDDDDDKDNPHTIPLLITAAVATALAALLHFMGVPGPAVLPQLIPMIFAAVATVVGLVIIAPSVKAAVLKKAIDINILMVIAVLGAWLLGDFIEGSFVLLLYCVGEWLEDFASDRNRASIEKLMDLTPQTVRVKQQDEVVEVSVEQVALGSLVLVRPGERIALDGIVGPSSGNATVDESPITGESVPVPKSPGDTLYAGSLSIDGRLEFTTTATVEDSTLARIIALVEAAQKKRTPHERFINRFARYYTPLVVVLALAVALIPTLITLLSPVDIGGITTWGYRALAMLVIACPCALVIATPVTVVSGLTRAARMGVLVKGGAFLELASKVRAVAFDKTGTLTTGRPQVVEVVTLESKQSPAIAKSEGGERYGNRYGGPGIEGSITAQGLKGKTGRAAMGLGTDGDITTQGSDSIPSLLLIAAALEQDSTHPLAHAVVQAAQAYGNIPVATQVVEQAGRGITALVQGQAVALGSPGFIGSMMELDEETRAQVTRMEQTAATVLVLTVDASPVGLIAVKDSVRAESPALVHNLTQVHGMQAVMLTGDNEVTARAIAQEAGVGVDKVYAGLLPNQKMERIEQLRQELGAVAMVGDGINDAPALALADVGIALGGAASDTAIQVADVALMGDNLEVLPAFFRLSRKVVGTIRTNVTFALCVKAAVMVLAILGLAQMWMAIFADTGVLVLILLYSMRLTRSRA